MGLNWKVSGLRLSTHWWLLISHCTLVLLPLHLNLILEWFSLEDYSSHPSVTHFSDSSFVVYLFKILANALAKIYMCLLFFSPEQIYDKEPPEVVRMFNFKPMRVCVFGFWVISKTLCFSWVMAATKVCILSHWLSRSRFTWCQVSNQNFKKQKQKWSLYSLQEVKNEMGCRALLKAY